MAGTGNILGVVELPSNWEHVGGADIPSLLPHQQTRTLHNCGSDFLRFMLCGISHPSKCSGYMSLNSQKGNKLPALRSYMLPFPVLKAVEQFCVHWVLLFPLACSRHL